MGRAAILQARASLAQAEAVLRRAQRNLGYCTIKSPVKGVIVDRRVNIGQTVVASLNAPSLFLIAKDLTRMQVWVAVNEADIGKIHPGLPVTFTVDAFPGETFRGEVGKVRLNASMTQNVHQGAFAGAGGAHQGDHFSPRHRERHAFEHGNGDFADIVSLVDLVKFDQFHEPLGILRDPFWSSIEVAPPHLEAGTSV